MSKKDLNTIKVKQVKSLSGIRDKHRKSVKGLGLKKINHIETYKKAHAERNILKVLEGDCETAVGAHATIHKNKITLEAELFSLDGKLRFYEKKTSTLNKFKQLGIEVGQSLKTKSNNSYKR